MFYVQLSCSAIQIGVKGKAHCEKSVSSGWKIRSNAQNILPFPLLPSIAPTVCDFWSQVVIAFVFNNGVGKKAQVGNRIPTGWPHLRSFDNCRSRCSSELRRTNDLSARSGNRTRQGSGVSSCPSPSSWSLTMKRKIVPLVMLSRELTLLTGQPAPKHRRLWTMVVNNELAAEKIGNGWQVDVYEAARALGMTARNAP
ncbi:MAG TPA: hypothetical protein VHO91_00980 [Rhodopila sp.]|nr:hypothetical protein [Rhodopila sp.]